MYVGARQKRLPIFGNKNVIQMLSSKCCHPNDVIQMLSSKMLSYKMLSYKMQLFKIRSPETIDGRNAAIRIGDANRGSPCVERWLFCCFFGELLSGSFGLAKSVAKACVEQS